MMDEGKINKLYSLAIFMMLSITPQYRDTCGCEVSLKSAGDTIVDKVQVTSTYPAELER